MMPSAKAALAAGLAVAMLVIAITARECTHRGREAELREEAAAWRLKHSQCELAIARASEDYAKAFSAAQARYTGMIKANEERRNEANNAIEKAVESDNVCRDWSNTAIPEQLRDALRQAR